MQIKDIAEDIADALPEDGSVRDELIALALVATGIIQNTPESGRADLVDIFCGTVRRSSAPDLN